MPKIRVLPDILASQVAAGEVVERPASVVKELIENSVDAGAKEILIEIERGGTAMLRVVDDGSGMAREDAMLSLERHATSKLRESSDLHSIMTLGFRGEAIPSIASVSRLRMITRERDRIEGTEMIVDGGHLRDVKDAGAAPGTTIEVRQLFFNVPARRKFLRAESTEASHIEHEVRLHALAAENIRFRYRRDGVDIFDLPVVTKKGDRLRHLLGIDAAAELIDIFAHHENGFAVEGFLLPALHARTGRKHQCFFLNGRPMEDIAISRGLIEGFRGGLVQGMNPAAWLWIEMEPQLVDVNVHPAKREVRFHRPVELREGVAAAVEQALVENRRVKSEATIFKSSASNISLDSLPVDALEVTSIFKPKPIQKWGTILVQKELVEVAPEQSSSISHQQSGASAFRLIGVIKNRFFALESTDGLVLFDPKAAHERIVYEQLMISEEGGLETQGLLVPILIELEPREFDLVVRNREQFATAGLEIEEFGGGTIQVRSFPDLVKVLDSKVFVHEVIDDLLMGGIGGAKFTFDKLARVLAKRAGIREKIDLSLAMNLLEKLFECDLPYCAADGRPTLTELSMKEIERRFHINGR
jgi:DNA mismatch repair protein MutL